MRSATLWERGLIAVGGPYVGIVLRRPLGRFIRLDHFLDDVLADLVVSEDDVVQRVLLALEHVQQRLPSLIGEEVVLEVEYGEEPVRF